jgi:hypothetical protein
MPAGVVATSLQARPMSDPSITCPHCQGPIKLSESLAAPLLARQEAEFKQQLTRQSAELDKRGSTLRAQEQQLQQLRASLDEQVLERLATERSRISAEEQRKARLLLGGEISAKQQELTELSELCANQQRRLAEAQQAQADIVRKERELLEAQQSLAAVIELRVNEGLATIQQKARQDADQQLRLKISERDLIIQRMQRQIDEMQRKAEQVSQQLQGEVQELDLETLLVARFPRDHILPIPKGEHGGDVLQHVSTGLGAGGSILWECKRTRHWSDAWLAKLRADQRCAKAEIAVIVSQALPKDVDSFTLIDNVYVVSPRCVVPLATTLRQALIEVAMARQACAGQQTKVEMVYQYLTGSRFRQRIQAIVEAFIAMQEDLNAEKRAVQRQWAKRQTQIERVIDSTAGLYGDLQGIAGKTLQEIEGLSLPMLDAPARRAS